MSKKVKVKPHLRETKNGKTKVRGHYRRLNGKLDQNSKGGSRFNDVKPEVVGGMTFDEWKSSLFDGDFDDLRGRGEKVGRGLTEYKAHQILDDDLVVHYDFHSGVGKHKDNWYGTATVYEDLGMGKEDGYPTYEWRKLRFDLVQEKDSNPIYTFSSSEEESMSASEKILERVRNVRFNPKHSIEIGENYG